MVANGKSAAEIGAIFNVHRKTVHTFVKKYSLGPWPPHATNRARELPEDFTRVAPTMPRVAAQAHWNCGAVTLTRWYKETGIRPALRASTLIVAPDDLAERVAGMSIKEAAEKLGINRKAAGRIMRDASLDVGYGQRTEKPAPVADNRWKAFKLAGAPPAPINFYNRNMTVEGQAQDMLQNDRWTVFRCDETGKADPSGKFWICGDRRVTNEELIERAERAARRMGRTIPWRVAARADTEMAA